MLYSFPLSRTEVVLLSRSLSVAANSPRGGIDIDRNVLYTSQPATQPGTDRPELYEKLFEQVGICFASDLCDDGNEHSIRTTIIIC